MPNFDRAVEDVGNVVFLEHVNTRVPDQQPATSFYVSGPGLTRDPYLMTGVTNMWINVGRSQFHLPSGKPQVLRGHTGLVIPDRESLLRRLHAVTNALEASKFTFKERDACVEATCPWGNRFRCHAPGDRFGRMTLGIPYVEFDVPRDSVEGIARFYRQMLGAMASVSADEIGRHARVAVGVGQDLVFRETDTGPPAFDGHHVAIYLTDFSGPYSRLLEKGLITQEDNQHQYRFQDIVDPDTGRVLFTVEHEVRSSRHPFYLRSLVNRNPALTNRNFAPGLEDQSWIGPASVG